MAPGPNAEAAEGEIPLYGEELENGEPMGRCIDERRAAELSAEPYGDELAANWLSARLVPYPPGRLELGDVLRPPVNGFEMPPRGDAPVRAAAANELLPIPSGQI